MHSILFLSLKQSILALAQSHKHKCLLPRHIPCPPRFVETACPATQTIFSSVVRSIPEAHRICASITFVSSTRTEYVKVRIPESYQRLATFDFRSQQFTLCTQQFGFRPQGLHLSRYNFGNSPHRLEQSSQRWCPQQFGFRPSINFPGPGVCCTSRVQVLQVQPSRLQPAAPLYIPQARGMLHLKSAGASGADSMHDYRVWHEILVSLIM